MDLLSKLQPDHRDVEKYIKIQNALLNWKDLPKGANGEPCEIPVELIDSFIENKVLDFAFEVWRSQSIKSNKYFE